jgi:hypothetical protein
MCQCILITLLCHWSVVCSCCQSLLKKGEQATEETGAGRTISRSDSAHERCIACISFGSPRMSASTARLVRLTMHTHTARRLVSSGKSPCTSSHGHRPRSSRRRRGRVVDGCARTVRLCQRGGGCRRARQVQSGRLRGEAGARVTARLSCWRLHPRSQRLSRVVHD